MMAKQKTRYGANQQGHWGEDRNNAKVGGVMMSGTSGPYSTSSYTSPPIHMTIFFESQSLIKEFWVFASAAEITGVRPR